MTPLVTRDRPADGTPSGLLILHHGRGTDESDLLPLADELDPDRRLHVVSARAPFTLPDTPGYHWYAVPRVGHPELESFAASYLALAELHDELWRRTGLAPEETILGGFSMGSVMSYALALGADRPPPAGIVAFSGFVPTVEGWRPELESREQVRIFIAHGRQDPVIDVAFARRARDLTSSAGLEVEYHESDLGHQIDRAHVALARQWVGQTLVHEPSRAQDSGREQAREG